MTTQSKPKFDLQAIDGFGLNPVYEPAKLSYTGNIDITGWVKEQIAALEKFNVSSDEEYALLLKAKSLLIAKEKAVKGKRIGIENELLMQFKPFETESKEFEKGIKQVLDKVRDIDKEKQQKDEDLRRLGLESHIAAIVNDYGVDANNIVWGDKWLNKGNFSGTLPKPDLLAEVEAQAKQLQAEMQQKEADRETVAKYAIDKGLEGDGYKALLDYKVLGDVMKQIDLDVQQREIDRQVAEAAQQEREAKQQTVGNKVMDPETGEVVGTAPQPAPQSPQYTQATSVVPQAPVNPNLGQPKPTDTGRGNYRFDVYNITAEEARYFEQMIAKDPRAGYAVSRF